MRSYLLTFRDGRTEVLAACGATIPTVLANLADAEPTVDLWQLESVVSIYRCDGQTDGGRACFRYGTVHYDGMDYCAQHYRIHSTPDRINAAVREYQHTLRRRAERGKA